MLDVSIKALGKVVTSIKKASTFIKKHVRAVEKIDGTKLTLIRNDTPFDPEDYTKNWIVSYKGNIIYPTEFHGLESRDLEIKATALGTSQYKFVHDHLRQVHRETCEAPHNTEFFVEFVQNKPTVTRDYIHKHGLFLIGFGEAQHAVSGGHVYSAGTLQSNPDQIKKYARLLRLGEFPVIFEGNFSSQKEILSGCVDLRVKEKFIEGFGRTDFSDPMSIVELVISVFSNLTSTLGGSAEGAVLHVEDEHGTGEVLYKVLAADQHTKAVRDGKKARYKAADDTEEKTYWSKVGEIAKEILRKIRQDEMAVMLSHLSRAVYAKEDMPFHPVKLKINIQEDIFLTAKLGLLYTGTNEAKKIALIPMAAKPFHAGHDLLLSQALEDGCQSVIVFLSTGGREEIMSTDMIPLWRKAYIPGIMGAYGKNITIRFTSSPVKDVSLFARNFASQKDVQVAVYGGVDGEGTNDAWDRVHAVISQNPDLSGKITAVGVDRAKAGGISGTLMRQFISEGNELSFKKNLPKWFGPQDRKLVWDTLKNKEFSNK